MSQKKQNYLLIKEQISHLHLPSPKIICVSKNRSPSEILNIYHQGAKNFGENYVSEAIRKINELQDITANDPITWHYIGAIQSRACKDIAKHFSWVQSLDREKIALKLNEGAKQYNKKLNSLIQINISEENTKSGISPSINEIIDFAHFISTHSNLLIRGMMIIPHPNDIQAFHRARNIFEIIKSKTSHRWDTLSMGMSGDFIEAVSSGSTMIRVGTALFK